MDCHMTQEMSHDEISRSRLDVLRAEHRALDQKISRLSAEAVSQALNIQRLKRQKLILKDRIARLEDDLTPDIIA